MIFDEINLFPYSYHGLKKCLFVMRLIKTWDQLDKVFAIISDNLPEETQQKYQSPKTNRR